MKHWKTILCTMATTSVLSVTNGQAIPTLQLDILGGTYDNSTETVVSNGDVFTLYAYLIEDIKKGHLYDQQYYISAAVTPKIAKNNSGDYGWFTIDGNQYDVTDDLVFGTPPVDDAAKNLAKHGIFKTYYTEIGFTFAASDTAAPANSEDNAGDGPQAGSGMYYHAFSVDTSQLADDYEIHFDLYRPYVTFNNQEEPKNRIEFAPFSHDAESRGGEPVPEPATMLLFGAGLAGLAGVRRKIKK